MSLLKFSFRNYKETFDNSEQVTTSSANTPSLLKLPSAIPAIPSAIPSILSMASQDSNLPLSPTMLTQSQLKALFSTLPTLQLQQYLSPYQQQKYISSLSIKQLQHFLTPEQMKALNDL